MLILSINTSVILNEFESGRISTTKLAAKLLGKMVTFLVEG